MSPPINRLWLTRKLILMTGDLSLWFGAFAVTFAIRDSRLLTIEVLSQFIPFFGLCLTVSYAAGLYDLRLVRDFVALVRGLLLSMAGAVLLGGSYFYILGPYLGLTPKTHLIVAIIAAHVGMMAWRRAVLTISGFSLTDLRIVLLATDDQREYLEAASQSALRESFNLVNGLGSKADLVVVDGQWTKQHPIDAKELLADAVSLRVPIISLASFYESLFGRVSPTHAADLSWALQHVLPRVGSVYFTFKRALDFVAALLLLATLMPVMVVIALVIWLVDGVSPLYGQSRTGHLGRTFRLWKFQTMFPQTGPDIPFGSAPTHQRVTRTGRVLRRYRLDELPQLWNVLKGEMSIVGPRPEWIKEVEVLEKAIPTYNLRYLVPPGITGWAQVYFRATNSEIDSVEKHQFDLYYIKHFSVALDFSIMLKTIKRVFVPDAEIPFRPLPGSVPDSSAGLASLVDRR